MEDYDNKEIGKLGERLAADFLQKRGYEIIDKNFTCPVGEIDLVARDNGTVVFIEVKSRSSNRFGLPIEAVDFHKRRKMVQVALFYMKKNNLSGFGLRFDIVSVLINRQEEKALLNLTKNAF